MSDPSGEDTRLHCPDGEASCAPGIGDHFGRVTLKRLAVPEQMGQRGPGA